eukprot:jgi/Bigna1/82367/fgenesh1_pg.91_\
MTMAAKAAAASKKKRKNESAAADAAKAAAAVAARAEIDLRDSSSQNPPKPEEEEEEEECCSRWDERDWERNREKIYQHVVRRKATAAQVRAAKRFLQGQPEERHKNWPRYAQKKKKQQQQQPPPQASGKRTLKARPPALKRKRDQEHGATAPTATEAGTEGKRPNDKIRNSPRGRLPTGLDLRSRRRRMLAWAQGYVEKVCDRKEQQKSGKRSSYRVGQSLVPLS